MENSHFSHSFIYAPQSFPPEKTLKFTKFKCVFLRVFVVPKYGNLLLFFFLFIFFLLWIFVAVFCWNFHFKNEKVLVIFLTSRCLQIYLMLNWKVPQWFFVLSQFLEKIFLMIIEVNFGIFMRNFIYLVLKINQ